MTTSCEVGTLDSTDTTSFTSGSPCFDLDPYIDTAISSTGTSMVEYF
jgi:hypothetical protein